jgi:negative regulator of flagellin synthesis FlgM
MQVYGPTQLHSAQSIGAPHTTRVNAPAGQTYSTSIQDEVSISDAARLTEQVRDLPEIRQDLVDRIRAQIASGTYETSDKLDQAVEHLLDEIG